jgi:amino acid adenylation domain-containing protein
MTNVNGLKTLNDLLRVRAQESPGSTGYRWLTNGEAESATLTYGELDRGARAVAAELTACCSKGDRVILLYSPGLDFVTGFFGCLYAGVIAVPVCAPTSRRDAGRIDSILRDADPKVALTSNADLAGVKRWLAATEGPAPDVVSTGSLAASSAQFQSPTPAAGDVAYLQYTSGSTSSPKGVMITHENLLSNLGHITSQGGFDSDSVCASWLPHFHDMGLVYGLVMPLYNRLPAILFSPASFVQRPARWLQIITNYRVTHTGGPNFAYDLCVSRLGPEDREKLDLSHWSVAFNGAEPVRAQTMDRFADAFAPCGFRRNAFYPVYGLAESTLKATSGVPGQGARLCPVDKEQLSRNRVDFRSSTSSHILAGCGSAVNGHGVVIVDPETRHACSETEIGEIWLSGPSVAKGYWRRPDETRETFLAELDSRQGPYLRTGDLGFLHENELFVTGRLKDCIIIRGLNHYPQDIEITVEQCHPLIRAGGSAAFSIEAGNEEALAVAVEVKRIPQDCGAIIDAVRQAVADAHQLQVYGVALLRPGALPRTSSGKVRRQACREAFLSGDLRTLAVSTIDSQHEDSTPHRLPARDALAGKECAARISILQEWLSSEVARVLRLSVSEVQPDTVPAALGMDSLMAVELAYELERAFGLHLGVAWLLEGQSIRQLAAALAGGEPDSAPTIGSGASDNSEEQPFALSHGQQALWFRHNLSPRSATFNIARAVRIRSPLDLARLQAAWDGLVQRHAALRSTVNVSNEELYQQPHSSLRPPLTFVDTSMWTPQQLDIAIKEEARAPFDLATGPLVRMHLFSRGPADHLLVLVIHHIIADFWSVSVLLHELAEAYSRSDDFRAAGIAETMRGYVERERELLSGPEGERLWTYWNEQLAGAPASLQLPMSKPGRQSSFSRPAGCRMFEIDPAVGGAIAQFARERKTTVYAALMSIFATLMYRYSGQEDFLLGSPSHGRPESRYADSIGYFVNPLALRADFSQRPTFETVHARMAACAAGALDHAAFPFPLIVQRLLHDRDAVTPLFQVMFVLQRSHPRHASALSLLAAESPSAKLRIGEWNLEAAPIPQQATEFDLTLAVAQAGNALSARLEYDSALFGPETIERMIEHFKILSAAAIASPFEYAAELPLLSESEIREIVGWNATHVCYPPTRLHELIERQAALSPASDAVCCGFETISYRELNEKANQLARYLVSLGVGPESVVGVCMERSIELVVGLLAVLKAGGAYLPLNPEYPAERLEFMLAQSGASAVLCQQTLIDRLAAVRLRIIALDAALDAAPNDFASRPTSDLGRTIHGDTPAYVIYTSGSTGQPKGVVNTHAGIVNRLLWMQDRYRLTPDDSVLQKTSFSFDVSVWEFFWPLIAGARLVLAQPGGHRDPKYLARTIVDENITIVHFVPSMLQLFLTERDSLDCQSLRHVICSGEALSVDLQNRFLDRFSAELHNLYGPTEAAVDVTSWACRREQDQMNVPIGKPISNTRILLLDEALQPVPVDCPGELFIGGQGLARGYLKRGDLTAERFIPDPFGDEPGGRIYRTGDLARYRQDGAIEFLGRLDHQVKIRGFRVELREIETVLAGHPSVRECTVVLRDYDLNDRRLIAYFVSAAGGDPPSSIQLRRYLAEKLPDYMVPSFFVVLDSMPLSTNGKLDRATLPEPDYATLGAQEKDGLPVTPTERALADIWSEVLRVPIVGLADNFFELGGHSALVTQVVSKACQKFEVDIPLAAFFTEPTLAGMTELVEELLAVPAVAAAGD